MRRFVASCGLVLALVAASWAAVAAPGDAEAKRADALETKAMADMAAERWAQGLPAVTEVVRLRRRAQPVDDDALGSALLEYGTFLFALDRHEDADAALRESLAAFQRVPRHGTADDLLLAQRLEQHAELVQKGYGRTRWVIELLRQAVALREANPATSRGKLAETLTELGIHEMVATAYADADAHLARAQALLEPLAARPGVADDESRALLVQALVMRSGIASKLGREADADRMTHAAEAVRFADRYTQVEQRLLVLAAMSVRLELAGRIDDAIGAAERNVEMMGNNVDLFDEKRKGRSFELGLMADGFLSLGQLYLEKGDLPAARRALATARSQLDDSSELHFALAQLEEKSGHGESALEQFRTALRLRKESATEVSILFGTSRAPLGNAGAGQFGAPAGTAVTLGAASVLVPGAQFSKAAWLARNKQAPLEVVGQATDPAQLLIRARRVLAGESFRAEAAAAMSRARLSPGAVLVFVHGFNVTFDAALQRGAELARDLNFDGPVAVFSWPSQGSTLGYAVDRKSADASAEQLVTFLGEIEAATGARRIHIVAHSMGNRVLLPALARIAGDAKSAVRPRLGEIFFAAPAVPKAEFDRWLDTIVGRGVGQLTLYASHVDRAMWAGRLQEGTALAGFASVDAPLIHAGLDTIDITGAASDDFFSLNHDVFASNPVMSEDMRRLIGAGPRLRPDERLSGVLVPKQSPSGQAYWTYAPPPAATAARR